VSKYIVYVIPQAWKEIKELPGHMRQRIKRTIDGLESDSRPPKSKELHIEFEHELRRIRLERWRIVYAVIEQDRSIDVLAVRKRPPYDYGDLEELLAEAGKL